MQAFASPPTVWSACSSRTHARWSSRVPSKAAADVSRRRTECRSSPKAVLFTDAVEKPDVRQATVDFFAKLQNGSDIRGVAVEGLASDGVTVYDFGLATTPAMFFCTVATGHRYDGAIMLTASHLPFNRNGMKFFTAQGGLEKKDITVILNKATKACIAAAVRPGIIYNDFGFVLHQALHSDPEQYRRVAFMPTYCAFMRGLIKQGINREEDIDKPLKGFKIVVDAGNGAGGFYATEVLAPLGADVSGSQFLDPDGMFPNHVPNPEDKAAMQATTEAVLRSGADLGIVFDTDVDRSGVVDRSGSPINSNRMIALMAAIVLRDYPGSTIVTDSVTSNGLTTFIDALGGKHYRYKRGYKNVIGKGVELNAQGVQTELMMETSGHGAMKENYFLDDGAYTATKILIEMVRRRLAGQSDISTMLSELREPLESKEIRIKITDKEFKPVAAAVLDKFRAWVEGGASGATNWRMEAVNHEGWRVVVDEGDGRLGWVLLRSSLHDPLLVLNAESEIEGGVKTTVQKVAGFFAQNQFAVDASSLQK